MHQTKTTLFLGKDQRTIEVAMICWQTCLLDKLVNALNPVIFHYILEFLKFSSFFFIFLILSKWDLSLNFQTFRDTIFPNDFSC